MRRPMLPPQAVAWLTSATPGRVLLIGAGGPYPRLFAEAGHILTIIDRDVDAIRRVGARFPDATCLVAQAEALPFEPCIFDHVVTPQNFHTLAPGLVLSEFARVLDKDGTLAASYLVRDDSVPWVKRLATAVQRFLPTAMRGDYGIDSLDAVRRSPYFPQHETTGFRVWLQSTRANLVDTAAQAEGAATLDERSLTELREAVGALYDDVSRPPEPLQLPYQLTCLRAVVDHTELTAPIQPSEDGLRIVF